MRAGLLAVALAAALSSPAAAQLYPQNLRVACAAGNFLPDMLRRDWGESPSSQGTADGPLVQLWRNEETRTWTLLLVQPGGGTCALASGDDWSPVTQPREAL